MIYICIPTHNEQQTVGVVLWKLRQVLTDFPRDYQLLVADDASTDKTPEVLEPYTRVLPLTVIRSDQRQGAAASLEMLLREAVRRSEYPKRDVIAVLQADFSEEPDDMVPLIKRLEAGADVAVGNKVSSGKEPRKRRLARALASFFMRRQKWPEGVQTPFDGYRAYRLYAVKRAIEDRSGRRLLSHDGWAGHAQLLRAVLPHARRVDVVNVDDRTDRLQRARRERPFAALRQVRMLASGTEPAGLAGVQELDTIAATASRSRERAALSAKTVGAGRSANGAGRQRRPEGRDSQRTRSRSNGERRGGQERRPRASDEERPQRQKERGSRAEGGRRQPRAASTPAAAPEELVIQEGAAAEAPEAAEKPKRKRRRRKRGGQSGAAATGQPPVTGEDVPEAQSEAPGGEAQTGDASSGDVAAEGTGERKRRRRGGRRGGRGRRRRSGAAGEAGAEGTTDAGQPESSSPPPMETAARLDSE